MPTDPRESTHAVERELFLRSMTFDRRVSGAWNQLGNAMRDEFFGAGSFLYKEGSPADAIYFIVRGTVELIAPGIEPRELGSRSVVGIIDAQLERPHTRSALAKTDVEALVVSTDDWFEVFEDNFESTRSLILFLAAGLHELTLELPNGGFSDPDDAGPMPEPDPLPLVERVLTLREVRMFERASIQALVSLAPVAVEVRVRKGELLFAPDQIQGEFLVVARGLVELERENPRLVARFGPASVVGGSAALGDAERFYSARALSDSVLLRIREEDFFDVMEDHFDLARSVLAFMAEQRDHVTREIARRKSARPAA